MAKKLKSDQIDDNAQSTLTLPLVQLFERIHSQRLLVKQRERIHHFKHTFLCLVVCALLTYILQFHTQIYNALAGPFHLDRDQFVSYLKMYNNALSSAQSKRFSLTLEYLQLELGEDQIEQRNADMLRIYADDQNMFKGSLATFKRIKEASIVDALRPNRLYVKLPTSLQPHFKTRLPFKFLAFSIRTLRCIVRQLNVTPLEYSTWLEKSHYVMFIEAKYRTDAVQFNKAVLTKCGTLIGYLYRPKGELAYLPNSQLAFEFRSLDVALDASYPYYPYVAFLLGGLVLSWLFLKALFYFFVYVFHQVYRTPLVIHPIVRQQLREFKIDNLLNFNDMLFETHDDQHCGNLFLIDQKYVVLLNVDMYETNTDRLAHFENEAPLMIIPVTSITKVSWNGIAVENDSKWIPWPATQKANGLVSTWLHDQLMRISTPYLERRREEDRLARQEEVRRAQRAADERRLAELEHEEAELQRVRYGDDLDRMWEQVASASPQFIARFRFEEHSIVKSAKFPDTPCALCLEKFELGETYSPWPCTGSHCFHFNCMLEALRSRNTCPLCRHPVEAAYLPNRNELLHRLFTRMFFRVAT